MCSARRYQLYRFPDRRRLGPFLMSTPNSTTFIVDTPATYHNKACGFAFTDGHADIHKWKGCLVGGRAAQVVGVDLPGITAPNSTDPDLYYLSYHSPRLAGAAGNPY